MRGPPSERLTDLDVVVHHETSLAYLVSTTDDEDDAVWVPKSVVEFEPSPRTAGARVGVLTLPTSTALVKGLI